MTSVGHRPTLLEILSILNAITEISADIGAHDINAKEFTVRLTISREQLKDSVPEWGNGLPKPTWLFEEVKEQLLMWYHQLCREEQWVLKEPGYGSSIDALMTHLSGELRKVGQLNGLADQLKARILCDTILRLKELKERRKAGGVYSATEDRRERARRTWAEDEYEAPKREEEQRKKREYTNYSQQQNYEGNQWYSGPNAWEKAQQEAAARFRDFFKEYFNEPNSRHYGFPPSEAPPGNHRPWHVVLNVASDATRHQIQKAYRKLAAKYHPDRYKEADADARMAEINIARDEALIGL